MRGQPFLLLLLACGASGLLAAQQCPDGSPPPCVPRPTASRLDDRTWLVLPFENTTHAAEVAWLSEASANLLYLDMSRWTDIHVIDNDRVEVMLRGIPASTGRTPIQDGLTLARRLGAGNIVTGEFLVVAGEAQVVARAIDARSGAIIRSVRERLRVESLDSVSAGFTRVARRVLGVAPPRDATLGEVGTSSLDAYQEYLAGAAALSRRELASAWVHLSRAVSLDSAFALPLYNLEVLIGWDAGEGEYGIPALRHSAGLPPRERALIAGLYEQRHGDYARACAIYDNLLRTDSTDIEAWFNRGECKFHDLIYVPLPGQPGHYTSRGSRQAALESFLRALELDPTYAIAYEHVQDLLTSIPPAGCIEHDCRREEGETPQAWGVPYRIGDSLALVTETSRTIADALADTSMASIEARRTNRRLFLDIAARWIVQAPTSGEAYLEYAVALSVNGELDAALAASRRGAQVAPDPFVRLDLILFGTIPILERLGQMQEAAALVDSILSRDTLLAGIHGWQLWNTATSLGRFRRGAQARGLDTTYATFGLALSGLATDGQLRTLDSLLARQGCSPALANVLGFHAHQRGSISDTASEVPIVRLQAFLLAGDPASARRALERFDAPLLRRADDRNDPLEWTLSAESHLELGDSAVAFDRLTQFARRWPMEDLYAWFQLQPGPPFECGAREAGALGRGWLLFGDLALALHHSDEARRSYRMVVGMWSGADPEVQPAVARARDALASLGP